MEVCMGNEYSTSTCTLKQGLGTHKKTFLDKEISQILTCCNSRPTYWIEMAQIALESSWAKVPETPVLPYFADFPVVMGKKFAFSDFGPATYEQMLSVLPDIVGTKDTIVLSLGNGQKPIPFVELDLDELFQLVTTKVRSEPSSLIAEGNINVFKEMVTTAKEQNDEQARNVDFVHDFVYVSFMEAVAAKVIKNFYKISDPFSGKPLILVGNRKLFTENKQKRDAAEKRLAKKAEKLAKALEVRTADLQRKINSANQDDSDFYSSNGDDVSCHGGRHSDTPPFSSSSGEESDVEFQGKSMPKDTIPPALVGASQLGSSFTALGLPPPNPLGGTLGSVPVFTQDARSHKKRKSSKKSKKHQKKAKYPSHSKPKVSVVKQAKLPSSSSDSSSSDDDAQDSRQPQQVSCYFYFFNSLFFEFLYLLLHTTYPLVKHSWVTIFSQTENFQNSVLIKTF